MKLKICNFSYFLIRYVHVMSLLFKNYTKFKPKKDLQLQIKTVLFKRGALQQEQQQWWSNQWTLEPNIYGGGGWSPRRAVRWQSEHDAIIIVQLDRASASSAKQRKHWQESCEEYLPIKTRWIFSSQPPSTARGGRWDGSHQSGSQQRNATAAL